MRQYERLDSLAEANDRGLTSTLDPIPAFDNPSRNEGSQLSRKQWLKATAGGRAGLS
jgi:hypothetical protein